MAEFTQAVLDRTGLTVDYAWAETKVESLMVQVRQLAPSQRETWATFDDLPADVRTVVLDALGRAAENPRGYRSEQIGEYTYQLNTSRLGGSGVFTVAEEAVIASAGGDAGSGLYSVTIGGSPELEQSTPDVDWD